MTLSHGVTAHQPAQVDYLVTGDRKLQALQRFANARIVNPVEFIAILDSVSQSPE
jgi:predicted nucleic acid-binding protein